MLKQQPQPKKPEKKIGLFAGSIGVAIWLNTIETDDGPRKMRSITISPRRYKDSETGECKEAAGYNPGDLPALIFALQKAQEFVFTTPIPGAKQEEQDDSFLFHGSNLRHKGSSVRIPFFICPGP